MLRFKWIKICKEYSLWLTLYIHNDYINLEKEKKDEKEKERYLVVRAGQPGSALQPVDLQNTNSAHLAPNYQGNIHSLILSSNHP